MIRAFSTHTVRKQQELTNSLWEFEPCQGPYKGKKFQMITPCCWENYPEFGLYRGEGVFRKKFLAEGNIRLEFKGISHTATVYLDGKEIASHYNAYTMFDVIVKDLQAGEHLLEIKADNRFSEDSALHIPNDYMSYGGVSRPVVMENIGEVYIEGIKVTPNKAEDQWCADIELSVRNISLSDKTVTLCSKIAGKEFWWENIIISADNRAVYKGRIRFDSIEEWNLETPNLYSVISTIIENDNVVDDYIDRFGFRTIKIKGNHILLNDKSIRIKGFCRHEDHPQFGCSLPYSAMAADIAAIRHLGANSVRTSHYPNDELFLDLCDEQGILVWEEHHARGLGLKEMQNPHFEPQAEQVIKEMIPAHYNHPSIYVWGIMNECASDSEYGKTCYEKQYRLIKELDSFRPHTSASDRFGTDICLGFPDVVSYNIYPLWYLETPPEKHLDNLYQWIQKTEGKGKPFLISEIGAGGIFGCHNLYHSKWTEEYQAEVIEKQLKAVLEYDACCGVYIW